MEMVVTLDRLREMVEAYGAAAHRWPLAERDAALALVAASSEAHALVDEALTLDLMLDQASAAEPASAELVSRILAARPRALPVTHVTAPSVPKGLLGFWKARLHEIWPYGPTAIPAGALAASIMLGVTFGASIPAATIALGNLGLTDQVAADTPNDLGDDLALLAFADNQYPQEWQ
jgi:hypothetical protein